MLMLAAQCALVETEKKKWDGGQKPPSAKRIGVDMWHAGLIPLQVGASCLLAGV
jgi:hypothetical protein